MYIFGLLFVGLIAGVVAKLLTPDDDAGGLVATILLGIAGSFLAHYLGTAAGWYTEGEPVGFFASILGSAGLLLASRIFFRRGRG